MRNSQLTASHSAESHRIVNLVANGFTLVELMVVIVVIGILATSAIIILKPQTFFSQSRDARRQSDLRVVQTALEQYYAQNGAYPASDGIPFGSAWVGGSPAVTYLRLTPNDPQAPGKTYCYKLNAPSYELCAPFEQTPIPGGFVAPATCAVAIYNGCLTNPF